VPVMMVVVTMEKATGMVEVAIAVVAAAAA
jgi:hypothetical protein